jgi:hypothetical protein
VTKEEMIADEVLLMIEDGGEMPEVAFNGAVYYLTKDKNGPQLSLSAEDLQPLKKAVVQRFGFITLRDLDPENRTKSIYRGLARSYANWLRLTAYCQREQLSCAEVREQVIQALGSFLKTERHDVCEKGAESCINCTRLELEDYAGNLEINLDEIAGGWQALFQDG